MRASAVIVFRYQKVRDHPPTIFDYRSKGRDLCYIFHVESSFPSFWNLARPKAGLSFRVDEFGGGILVDGPMAAEG